MAPLDTTIEPDPEAFAATLLDWFAREGRHDLPWKVDPTPYRIWVSEVMLQQTQVATVVPYFHRFIERFPDVETLAGAPEDAVLAAWTGLGYYRRARNLWRAAQEIVQQHGGQLPGDPADLQRLPGIGRSTAGAIAAMAFGKRAAILDGNVKRVLTRFQGIDEWPGLRHVETRLWSLAEALTPLEDVANYTQAIMDLGATVCTRRQPACNRCPLTDACAAYREQRVEHWPAPRPKRAMPERSTRMIILEDTFGRILLQRRPSRGVWSGLWCFPEHGEQGSVIQVARSLLDAGPAGLTDLADLDTQATSSFRLRELDPWPSLHHQFTHFRLSIHLSHVKLLPANTRSGRDMLVEDHPPGRPRRRSSVRSPGALDTQTQSQTQSRLLEALDTQTWPERPRVGGDAGAADTRYAWFAVQEMHTVGLAAPVVRHLAQPSVSRGNDHG